MLVATRGGEYSGDIAVDDLKVSSGPCHSWTADVMHLRHHGWILQSLTSSHYVISASTYVTCCCNRLRYSFVILEKKSCYCFSLVAVYISQKLSSRYGETLSFIWTLSVYTLTWVSCYCDSCCFSTVSNVYIMYFASSSATFILYLISGKLRSYVGIHLYLLWFFYAVFYTTCQYTYYVHVCLQ